MHASACIHAKHNPQWKRRFHNTQYICMCIWHTFLKSKFSKPRPHTTLVIKSTRYRKCGHDWPVVKVTKHGSKSRYHASCVYSIMCVCVYIYIYIYTYILYIYTHWHGQTDLYHASCASHQKKCSCVPKNSTNLTMVK
jgi:hypothetical protein